MMKKHKQKKARNKQYNPKKHHINVNAVADTIHLSLPVNEYSQGKLNEAIHGSLLAITSGVGEPLHFDVLASTVDLVFLMSKNLFQDAYSDEIQQARQAMFRLKDRFHHHGVFGFDGEGYQAIKELIAIHDDVMKNVTGSEVLQFMKARKVAIDNGNFYRNDVERLAA